MLYVHKDVKKATAIIMSLVRSSESVTLPLESPYYATTVGVPGQEIIIHIHDCKRLYASLFIDAHNLSYTRIVTYNQRIPRKVSGNVVELLPPLFEPIHYVEHVSVMRLVKHGLKLKEEAREKAGCTRLDNILRIPRKS